MIKDLLDHRVLKRKGLLSRSDIFSFGSILYEMLSGEAGTC
jgi:serine/threonine protein kinase